MAHGKFKVLDSDIHTIEPPDLWTRYIDPAFRDRAPGMPYAHPTVEHFAPLFVTLGAAADAERSPHTEIDGFFLGLAKRSFQMA